jgi:hypothetical protein
MQVLGMDLEKENWDHWTINIQDKDFQKKVSDFSPDLFDYLKRIWKDKP